MRFANGERAIDHHRRHHGRHRHAADGRAGKGASLSDAAGLPVIPFPVVDGEIGRRRCGANAERNSDQALVDVVLARVAWNQFRRFGRPNAVSC